MFGLGDAIFLIWSNKKSNALKYHLCSCYYLIEKERKKQYKTRRMLTKTNIFSMNSFELTIYPCVWKILKSTEGESVLQHISDYLAHTWEGKIKKTMTQY